MEHHVPHIINISFPQLTAEYLVTTLDRKGVAVSAGAACEAGVFQPSPVLQAMRLDDDHIRSAIRLSWGRFTSIDDVDTALARLAEIVHT